MVIQDCRSFALYAAESLLKKFGSYVLSSRCFVLVAFVQRHATRRSQPSAAFAGQGGRAPGAGVLPIHGHAAGNSPGTPVDVLLFCCFAVLLFCCFAVCCLLCCCIAVIAVHLGASFGRAASSRLNCPLRNHKSLFVCSSVFAARVGVPGLSHPIWSCRTHRNTRHEDSYLIDMLLCCLNP